MHISVVAAAVVVVLLWHVVTTFKASCLSVLDEKSSALIWKLNVIVVEWLYTKLLSLGAREHPHDWVTTTKHFS